MAIIPKKPEFPKPARILIIEDNAANLKLMAYLLQSYGYLLESRRNGLEGLELAKREHFDLIVCDVHLPKLDGYGVLRALLGNPALSHIPVIAVTALAMVGDRDKMLAAGFSGYISKPINPETFVRQVEAFFAKDLHSGIQPERPASKGSRRLPARIQKDITILIVDDTPANISFARSTLEPTGYTCHSARSVEEAVTAIASNKPALILSDLHMPGRTACDLMQALRSNPAVRDIPLLIISSSVPRETAQCMAHGATGFIRRPIEPKNLLERIETVLQQTARQAAAKAKNN